MGKEENEVTKDVNEYLERAGYLVYRINNLAVRGRKFRGRRGMTDLIAFKPKECVYFIEVKKPGEKPTKEQLDFIEMINVTKSDRAFWCDSFNMFYHKFVICQNQIAL